MPKKIQQYSTTLTPSNNVLKTLEIKQTPSVSFPAKFSPELLTWTTPVSGHFYLLYAEIQTQCILYPLRPMVLLIGHA